jgi:hypothetical protein
VSLFTDCQIVAAGPPSSSHGGASLNAKKILIVEDSYPIAESMSRTIAEVGFATVGPVDTADRANARNRAGCA